MDAMNAAKELGRTLRRASSHVVGVAVAPTQALCVDLDSRNVQGLTIPKVFHGHKVLVRIVEDARFARVSPPTSP
jgi:hypothetical protein